jgi:hypothetical protein
VRNLPFNITSQEMYDIFGKFGGIRQVRVGCNKDTRGTAYVVFDDIHDAKQACDHLSGFNVANRYVQLPSCGKHDHHTTNVCMPCIPSPCSSVTWLGRAHNSHEPRLSPRSVTVNHPFYGHCTAPQSTFCTISMACRRPAVVAPAPRGLRHAQCMHPESLRWMNAHTWASLRCRYLIVLYYNPNRQTKKLSTKEQEEQLRSMQEKYGVDGEQHAKKPQKS